MNRGPSADGRAVHPEAGAKSILRQPADRVRNVVPETVQVAEAEIENLHALLLGKLYDSGRIDFGG